MSIEIGIQNLYNNNRDMIFNLVTANSGTYDEAKDIMQEGVIAVYNRLNDSSMSPLTCSLSTYLYSVCKNIWLNELRKKGKSTILIDTEINIKDLADSQEIEILLEKEQKIVSLEKGLEQLGDTCKNLLKLFYYQRKSLEEIISVVGLSNTNAAKTKKYKCIQQLKAKVSSV